MSEPALKCENYAIFKQNYTQKLFISFKISYYCCFGLRGNLEFPDILQKKFYNIIYRKEGVDLSWPVQIFAHSLWYLWVGKLHHFCGEQLVN